MTVATADAQTDHELSHRGLISDQLWNRLVNRIVLDEGFDQELAERIANETLGFLQLVGQRPGEAYSPSSLVDVGWHTFIVHTREYAAFCDRIAGGFIHHEPTEPGSDADGRTCVDRTVGALRELALAVDDAIWERAADCEGKRCHADCRGAIDTTP